MQISSDLLGKLYFAFAKVPLLVKLGKLLCRFFRLEAYQPYFGGVIFFEPRNQSWAFKNTSYEKIDFALKEALLNLSFFCDIFVDIGCNIGSFSLFILLKNKNINVTCVDPNPVVIHLLRKSLVANNFQTRVKIIQSAISNKTGSLYFECPISETGHVSLSGMRINSFSFSDYLNSILSRKCLVKIDIEGHETQILSDLILVKNKFNLLLVCELHAAGYHQGDPQKCINLLLRSGAKISSICGIPIKSVTQDKISQVLASWD